jgi:hypothetical protein
MGENQSCESFDYLHRVNSEHGAALYSRDQDPPESDGDDQGVLNVGPKDGCQFASLSSGKLCGSLGNQVLEG